MPHRVIRYVGYGLVAAALLNVLAIAILAIRSGQSFLWDNAFGLPVGAFMVVALAAMIIPILLVSCSFRLVRKLRRRSP